MPSWIRALVLNIYIIYIFTREPSLKMMNEGFLKGKDNGRKPLTDCTKMVLAWKETGILPDGDQQKPAPLQVFQRRQQPLTDYTKMVLAWKETGILPLEVQDSDTTAIDLQVSISANNTEKRPDLPDGDQIMEELIVKQELVSLQMFQGRQQQQVGDGIEGGQELMDDELPLSVPEGSVILHGGTENHFNRTLFFIVTFCLIAITNSFIQTMRYGNQEEMLFKFADIKALIDNDIESNPGPTFFHHYLEYLKSFLKGEDNDRKALTDCTKMVLAWKETGEKIPQECPTNSIIKLLKKTMNKAHDDGLDEEFQNIIHLGWKYLQEHAFKLALAKVKMEQRTGIAPSRPRDQGAALSQPRDQVAAPSQPRDQGVALSLPRDQGAVPSRPRDQGAALSRLTDQEVTPSQQRDQVATPSQHRDQGAALSWPREQGVAPSEPRDQGTAPSRPRDQGAAPSRSRDQGTVVIISQPRESEQVTSPETSTQEAKYEKCKTVTQTFDVLDVPHVKYFKFQEFQVKNGKKYICSGKEEACHKNPPWVKQTLVDHAIKTHGFKPDFYSKTCSKKDPYECICGKSFTKKASLKNHEKKCMTRKLSLTATATTTSELPQSQEMDEVSEGDEQLAQNTQEQVVSQAVVSRGADLCVLVRQGRDAFRQAGEDNEGGQKLTDNWLPEVTPFSIPAISLSYATHREAASHDDSTRLTSRSNLVADSMAAIGILPLEVPDSNTTAIDFPVSISANNTEIRPDLPDGDQVMEELNAELEPDPCQVFERRQQQQAGEGNEGGQEVTDDDLPVGCVILHEGTQNHLNSTLPASAGNVIIDPEEAVKILDEGGMLRTEDGQILYIEKATPISIQAINQPYAIQPEAASHINSAGSNSRANLSAGVVAAAGLVQPHEKLGFQLPTPLPGAILPPKLLVTDTTAKELCISASDNSTEIGTDLPDGDQVIEESPSGQVFHPTQQLQTYYGRDGSTSTSIPNSHQRQDNQPISDTSHIAPSTPSSPTDEYLSFLGPRKPEWDDTFGIGEFYYN